MTYNPNLLDGLSIFNEVVSAGSFTLAAHNTGHSTSHISKEINKLEERLKVRLMQRTTRSLSLTPEGELFHQQCLQIIADAQQAQNALLGQQSTPTGTLRVSSLSSLHKCLMEELFSEFLLRYPEINLELEITNRKVDMVSEGFDVIIRGTPQLEDSSFISKCIMQSKGITLASPEYLARRGIPERPEDLKDHDCITYSYLKQPKLWTFKNQYGKETQLEVSSRIQSNSSEMELALCKAGHGIVRLPEFTLQDELETGSLVKLFPDYQEMSINVFMVYPSRQHLSPKVRAFIDFVSNFLEQEK